MAGSPCANSLISFHNALAMNQDVYAPLMAVINAGMTPPPVGYSPQNDRNEWHQPVGAKPFKGMAQEFAAVFTDWCTFLPSIQGDEDNGLTYIQKIGWFYYQNFPAQAFTQEINPMTGLEDSVLATFLKDFSDQRGAFMNSEPSALRVPEWINDPRIEIEDYEDQTSKDFSNWNAFFSRLIKSNPDGTIPSRPVTMPDRKYVVVSPTDRIMNPLYKH